MLTDFELALLLQQQYDAVQGIFDFAERIDEVSFGVKHYPDCTVIAFEGSYNIPDWFSNFDAVMIRPPGLGGVEQGFYDGLPEALAAISPMLSGKVPVYVAGHSRGAAHAHIFGAMLINAGYTVEVVVFGSPRPGDAALAHILQKAPNRSYRNYHDWDLQDWVTDVPLDVTIISPYVHPVKQIAIDVVPPDPDSWGVLKMHHIQNYIKALKGMANG